MKSKKAGILHENIIFIILNLVFLTALIVFIYLQTSSVHLMEEENAKKIALMIDVLRPGTEIELELAEFFEKAEKEGTEREKSVVIDNEKNLVIVRGSEDSFYEYDFFNDLEVAYKIQGNKLLFAVKEND